MTFTASSAQDVQTFATSFASMTDKTMDGDQVSLQVQISPMKWRRVTFDELLAWPFDGPAQVTIFELDGVE